MPLALASAVGGGLAGPAAVRAALPQEVGDLFQQLLPPLRFGLGLRHLAAELAALFLRELAGLVPQGAGEPVQRGGRVGGFLHLFQEFFQVPGGLAPVAPFERLLRGAGGLGALALESGGERGELGRGGAGGGEPAQAVLQVGQLPQGVPPGRLRVGVAQRRRLAQALRGPGELLGQAAVGGVLLSGPGVGGPLELVRLRAEDGLQGRVGRRDRVGQRSVPVDHAQGEEWHGQPARLTRQGQRRPTAHRQRQDGGGAVLPSQGFDGRMFPLGGERQCRRATLPRPSAAVEDAGGVGEG